MLKSTLGVVLVLTAAATAAHSIPGNSTATATAFAGSTPCDEPVRRFLGITNAACQQVTWNLSLTDGPAGGPFALRARYHMPIPSSPNHLDGGKELQLSGVWTSAAGTGAHSGRTVYSLTTDGRSLRLVLLERDLLQLLTADSRLMVGNGG